MNEMPNRTWFQTYGPAEPGDAWTKLLALAEIGIPILPQFAAPKRWSF